MTKDEELIEQLRAALIACGRHAGAMLADDVSSDFLMLVPEEVRLKLAASQTEALARPVVGVQIPMALMQAVEDFINEPQRSPDIEPMEVRDYRHALYRVWSPLCQAILTANTAALAASPSPVVGDREAIADSLKHCKALILSTGREIPVADGKITLPGDLTDTERTELRGILSLSTPVVGGIKDALGQTLTLIDDLYREYGIALNDEHVAVARHARGVWLDALDPHTTDRAGMAQEVE